MKAYRIETTLTENGTLTLQGLPFQAGEPIEIIVLERQGKPSDSKDSNPYPLRGTVIRYDDPFEPTISPEDWEVLK